jgi:hypothetical protein
VTRRDDRLFRLLRRKLLKLRAIRDFGRFFINLLAALSPQRNPAFIPAQLTELSTGFVDNPGNNIGDRAGADKLKVESQKFVAPQHRLAPGGRAGATRQAPRSLV